MFERTCSAFVLKCFARNHAVRSPFWRPWYCWGFWLALPFGWSSPYMIIFKFGEFWLMESENDVITVYKLMAYTCRLTFIGMVYDWNNVCIDWEIKLKSNKLALCRPRNLWTFVMNVRSDWKKSVSLNVKLQWIYVLKATSLLPRETKDHDPRVIWCNWQI